MTASLSTLSTHRRECEICPRDAVGRLHIPQRGGRYHLCARCYIRARQDGSGKVVVGDNDLLPSLLASAQRRTAVPNVATVAPAPAPPPPTKPTEGAPAIAAPPVRVPKRRPPRVTADQALSLYREHRAAGLTPTAALAAARVPKVMRAAVREAAGEPTPHRAPHGSTTCQSCHRRIPGALSLRRATGGKRIWCCEECAPKVSVEYIASASAADPRAETRAQIVALRSTGLTLDAIRARLGCSLWLVRATLSGRQPLSITARAFLGAVASHATGSRRRCGMCHTPSTHRNMRRRTLGGDQRVWACSDCSAKIPRSRVGRRRVPPLTDEQHQQVTRLWMDLVIISEIAARLNVPRNRVVAAVHALAEQHPDVARLRAERQRTARIGNLPHQRRAA